MTRHVKQILPFAGPTLALGAVGVFWLITSPYTVRRAFLADVLVVALLASVIPFLRPSVFGMRRPIILWWLVCGALLAAALVGPLTIAFWIAVGALLVSFAASLHGGPQQPRKLVRFALLGCGAAINCVVLWIVLLGAYRPLPLAEFELKPLRVHTLLTDVPLHDVWVIRLRGGAMDGTIEEVFTLMNDGIAEPPNAAVAGLFALRGLLGLVFSLDGQECADPDGSYVHRLSEDDRARSRRKPSGNGVLYVFEREALVELVNCTVHAFIAVALEPAEDGQRLKVGIYVKQNRDITPYYMALIDPFRRLIVYPVAIEYLERHWARVTSATD